MLITLIFKGQRLSKSICLFLSQTFLWGKALKGHFETLSHKSIAITIVGSRRAPFVSVYYSLGLHISHSQKCHTSMSQSLFLSSAQTARAQDELLFTSSPKALSLSNPDMQHEKANGPHACQPVRAAWQENTWQGCICTPMGNQRLHSKGKATPRDSIQYNTTAL